MRCFYWSIISGVNFHIYSNSEVPIWIIAFKASIVWDQIDITALHNYQPAEEALWIISLISSWVMTNGHFFMTKSILLLLWWPILWLFILLCWIESTVNELEVVDCTLELTFHSSSDLLSVTELTFLDS